MLTGLLPIIVFVITLIVSKLAPPLDVELPFDVDAPAPLVAPVPMFATPAPVAVEVWKSISRFELGAHMLMQACMMLRLPSERSSSIANS
uniref:Putative secreted protein n=1 Tax=Anopheles darlingi TaxID=43151 RepID=A0A2M4DCG5_ANODA